MRDRQSAGRLRDEFGGAHGIDWTGRDEVAERLTGRPLGDDVGTLAAIVGVEDLDQPRIG
jgi:hypothetical protein